MQQHCDRDPFKVTGTTQPWDQTADSTIEINTGSGRATRRWDVLTFTTTTTTRAPQAGSSCSFLPIGKYAQRRRGEAPHLLELSNRRKRVVVFTPGTDRQVCLTTLYYHIGTIVLSAETQKECELGRTRRVRSRTILGTTSPYAWEI